jgi:4-hydroxybenzoate polyprenyltransferase
MPPQRPPFFTSLSQRLLPALQLTRMALVFTAIADSGCTLLLQAEALRRARGGASVWAFLDWRLVTATVLIAIGLYGYGMSLNDIIDRRRDKQVAAHRPLPSGRLSVASAHLICFLLAMLALGSGIFYALHDGPGGWKTLVLVVWTGARITFYDYAGKYLVAPGLLTLGLIRFFHALIPAPGIPLLWHALLLLNHITLLSTVAYGWEEKRPMLTRRHWGLVLGGLGVVDAVAIAGVWWRRSGGGVLSFPQALWVDWGLAVPGVAIVLFVVLVAAIRRRSAGSREAGQAVMLIGLLWLIVYDAAFAAGYVSLMAGGALLLLLPVAWWAVRFMRWWSKVLTLSQRPTFKRVET